MMRHRIVAIGAGLAAAAAIGAGGGAPQPAAAERPPRIEITTSPEDLAIYGLPCTPGFLTVGITNHDDEPTFVDVTIEPEAPLTSWRSRFTSYLPDGQTTTALVELRAPRDAAPGTYDVRLQADHSPHVAAVEVLPAPPKGPGDNLSFGEEAIVSSTHGNFDRCGGLDGNANSEQWDISTGWNDGTRAVFPDTYGVVLAAPAAVDRVEIDTLDSARWPATTNGIRDVDVQARVGGEWQTVASVRGNTLGHITSTFPAVRADAVQLVIFDSNDHAYSRVVELAVFGT